ncbi:thioredoxin family protein [Bremerella cremea]
MIRTFCVFLLSFHLISLASAGEFNPVLDVGQAVTPWKDLEGTDEAAHTWDEFKTKKVLVVAFTCNTCPYVVDYQDRLKKLASKWNQDDRVAVVAVNSNLIDEDSLEAMTEHAQKAAFNFLYLKDANQELGKAWGATRTPEFFVLNEDRKVVYMGAMDNDTNAEKATLNYVDLAVEAALAGKQPEVQETVAIGCNIRYKRSRRSR